MDSSSDALLQQKKGDDEMVKWNEFVALQNSLTQKVDKVKEDLLKEIDRTGTDLFGEIQRVEGKMDVIARASETQQAQLTTLQNSVAAMTQQMTAIAQQLNTLVIQRPPEDNASVDAGHDDARAHEDANYFPAGHGRGIAQHHGRGGHMPQARRIPVDNGPAYNREDDGLGRPKFSIPSFRFDTDDVEEYIR